PMPDMSPSPLLELSFFMSLPQAPARARHETIEILRQFSLIRASCTAPTRRLRGARRAVSWHYEGAGFLDLRADEKRAARDFARRKHAPRVRGMKASTKHAKARP